MIRVFGMVEDGEGFFAVEAEVGLKVLPFAVIDLNGELLGAAVVAAIGDAVLLFEVADFLSELFAFRTPWDESGMGVAVNEAEIFGGSFEFVSAQAC